MTRLAIAAAAILWIRQRRLERRIQRSFDWRDREVVRLAEETARGFETSDDYLQRVVNAIQEWASK